MTPSSPPTGEIQKALSSMEKDANLFLRLNLPNITAGAHAPIALQIVQYVRSLEHQLTDMQKENADLKADHAAMKEALGWWIHPAHVDRQLLCMQRYRNGCDGVINECEHCRTRRRTATVLSSLKFP